MATIENSTIGAGVLVTGGEDAHVENVEISAPGDPGLVPYITIRLSRVAFDRLEALRSQHGSAEFRPARAQVLRAVIDKGFETMDKRADLKRRVHGMDGMEAPAVREATPEENAALDAKAGIVRTLSLKKPKAKKAR